jgi:2-iminobutanoate/2-iminopropanoate deaminase
VGYVAGGAALATAGSDPAASTTANISSTEDSDGGSASTDTASATHGDLVWTAGHLPEATSPGDRIESQTKAVMEDLETTLQEAGADFDTVVMTNVYLADFDEWPAFNETYKRYFEGRLPPRVTVEVSSLAFGYDIEISMVAYVREDLSRDPG